MLGIISKRLSGKANYKARVSILCDSVRTKEETFRGLESADSLPKYIQYCRQFLRRKQETLVGRLLFDGLRKNGLLVGSDTIKSASFRNDGKDCKIKVANSIDRILTGLN
jgi:hypothetical protein